MPIAHDLEQSGAALLNGGVAPESKDDDDDVRIPALTGTLERLQLRQEQSLIHDLVATGNELLAGRREADPLTANERYQRRCLRCSAWRSSPASRRTSR